MILIRAYITEGSITQDRQQRVNVALTGEVKSGPHMTFWRHDSSGISADRTINRESLLISPKTWNIYNQMLMRFRGQDIQVFFNASIMHQNIWPFSTLSLTIWMKGLVLVLCLFFKLSKFFLQFLNCVLARFVLSINDIFSECCLVQLKHWIRRCLTLGAVC